MWHNKLAANDEVFKLTFDHLRNLGICAALLVASNWRFKNAGDGVYFWMDCFAGAVVGIVAVMLWLANAAHLGRKLFEFGFSRRAGILLSAIPGALFVAMVMPHVPYLLDLFR